MLIGYKKRSWLNNAKKILGNNPSLSLLVQLEWTLVEAIAINRENGLSEMQMKVERNKGERQRQLTEEEG